MPKELLNPKLLPDKYLELKDRDKIQQTFVSAIAIFSIISLVLILFLLIAGQYFPKLFNVDKSNFEIKLIVLLLSLP